MINIAFLYYDLMNLYGESGNIKALTKELDNQGIKYNIDYLTISDKLEFSKYNLVYIGYGTEKNQELVLNHLTNYKDDIKNYIEKDKYMLITGNALEMFGNSISRNNKMIECLKIFNYNTFEEERHSNEAIYKFNGIDHVLLGFQNQQGYIFKSSYPLFEVMKGKGYTYNNTEEGIHYKNFYGTFLIGPLLSRNPYFLEYFVKQLELSINPKFKFKKFDLDLEKEAYKTFINLYCQK